MVDKAIFLKKLNFFKSAFNLQSVFSSPSTQQPYEPKWERQTIPSKSENSDYIITYTFDSTRHPAVLVYPYCSSYVQHTKQYFSFSFLNVLMDVPVMALTSASVLPFDNNAISRS